MHIIECCESGRGGAPESLEAKGMATRGTLGAVLVGAWFFLSAPQIQAQAPAAVADLDHLPSSKLLLKSGSVDLGHQPSMLSPNAVFDGSQRYVIHLDGPMTPHRRAALVAAGVGLREYLPVHAYVAELGGADARALADLGFVDWVGIFEDSWKLCPTVGRVAAASRERREIERRGRRLLAIETFSGVPAGTDREALEARGAAVRAEARRGTRRQFIAEVPLVKIAEIGRMKEVMFVEEVLEAEPRNASNSWILQSNISEARTLWDAGLHGENQIIGLIDWDMYDAHCAFADPGGNPIGPLHRKIQAYYGAGINPTFGDHGTHVAGNCVGDELANSTLDLKGMAYKARLVFQHYPGVLSGGQMILSNRLPIAHNDGARIHSNSWGSSSTSYGSWARDIDQFTRTYEDDMVLVAVANFGASGTPENAKNCLAVAGTSDTPNQGNYCRGSTGPTTDGRLKPEVFGVACGSRSALDNSACGINDTGAGGGTSFATPSVAGLAALARQYCMEGMYPTGFAAPAHAFTPTGALLKALVINSAVDMSGMPGYMTNSEGWGRVLMDDAIYLAGDDRRLLIEDIRNADGLSTGEIHTYYVGVGAVSMPLKVTLVWTDEPAALNAAFTPVNNLDLVVTAPDAGAYLGNDFSGAESTTGGAADFKNNTEQVHRTAPALGVWRIDVNAAAVNAGTQGYALVVTGDVDCLRGDVNADGLVNGEDVGAFVNVVLYGGTFFQRCTADMNLSGAADEMDVDEFVAAILQP